MAILTKITVAGHRPIYRYNDDVLVYVNKQSDFRPGLRDIQGHILMSKVEADKAKSMPVTLTENGDAEHCSKCLEYNGFRLI